MGVTAAHHAVGMTLTPRAKWWVASAVFGLLLVGLGGYFAVVGLDRADQLSGIGGLFVGLIGLALAAYGTYAARSTGPPPAPAPAPAPTAPGGVRGNTFHGPAFVQSGENNRQENHHRP